MTDTMKTLRLHAPRDLRSSDEPVPAPGGNEVLLKIGSVGVCASDVHYYEEGAIGDAVVEEPLVLGHEAGGVVAALGPNVTSLKPGDTVAIEPGDPCGACPVCRQGLINLCPYVRFFGTPPTDGALRQYVAWPADLCVPVPAAMTVDEAAMTEPMAVGIYAVDLAAMQGGETVAVLGAGAIGLSVLQAARVAGASRIWVVEPIASRAQMALAMGADAALTGDPATAIEEIRDQTGQAGVNAVFECAGTNDAVRQAVRLATYDGLVVVAGIPYPDEVSFAASAARRKNLTLKFVRRSRNALKRAIQWASEGKIDLKSYVTHRFPLREAAQAIELARDRADGVIRAVITLDDA